MDYPEGYTDLTPRELAILEQLNTGKTVKEIALRLGISVKTVEAHKSHIFTKLGCNSSLQVVVLTNYIYREED